MRNYLRIIKAMSLAALMLFSFGKANATHFMGGDITYVCIGPNQYSIVAKLLKDCNGSASLPQLLNVTVRSVNCGLNQTVQLNNLSGATNSFIAPVCDLSQDACVNSGAYGVEQYFYRGILTIPNSCSNGSDIELGWSTCCRNGIITTGAANEGNYLYATLNNTLSQCNSSPAFNFEPTLYFCLGQENNFNQGVTDIDGDELNFSFTECLDQGSTAANPVPVPYTGSFSATNPLTNTNISIDAQTGQISLTPTALEVGVICVLVEEFRSGVKIGETIRDLQVAVIDCGNNDLPIISGFDGTATEFGATGPYSYTGCVGEIIEFDLESFDPQGIPTVAAQNVTMNWGIGIAGASFIIDDTTSTLPSATFRWIPTAADVGTNFFTVKIEDDACPINGISVFTYKINIQASGLNYSPNTSTDTIICEAIDGVPNPYTLDINQGNFGPGFQFYWSTNTTDSILSCYNCIDPVLTPIIGAAPPNGITTYQIFMIYKNLGSSTNCVIRDTFTIQVENCISTTPIENLVKDVVIAPNPFTTNATLSYSLYQRSDVVVEMFDLVGRKVGTLANEKQQAGEHQIQLGDAVNQVKGVYFVRLSIDGEVLTKKVLVQ